MYTYLYKRQLCLSLSWADKLDDLTKVSTSDPEGYLAHPVNAYKLMKRLNTEWSELESLVLQNPSDGKEISPNLYVRSVKEEWSCTRVRCVFVSVCTVLVKSASVSLCSCLSIGTVCIHDTSNISSHRIMHLKGSIHYFFSQHVQSMVKTNPKSRVDVSRGIKALTLQSGNFSCCPLLKHPACQMNGERTESVMF